MSNNTLRTAGLTWSAKWNDIYSTRVQVTDSQSVYKTQPSFYRTETNLRGYLFQNEFRFGPHLVTATLERREDALENAPTTSSKLLSRDRSQDAISLGYGFVQGPHSLQLHVRHDRRQRVRRQDHRQRGLRLRHHPDAARHGIGRHRLPRAHAVPALQRVRRVHAAARKQPATSSWA